MVQSSYNIPLIPNPGNLGRYEKVLASNFEFPVYQSCFNGDAGSDKVNRIEFGSNSLLAKFGIVARMSYSFWDLPREPDAIISSGHIGKEIIPHYNQHHFHLSHGIHRGSFGLPPRDSFSNIFPKQLVQKFNRLWLREHEENLLSSIDTHIVNSRFTADLFEHYYNIVPDKVINPPVDTKQHYNNRPTNDEFYFYVGRLEPIKRVQEIVNAFTGLDVKLLVAGSGSQEETLREVSSENVQICGYISESQKRRYLSRCSGFIQNSIGEDFGMTTVEALASGAPVIAVRDGNNPNLVTNGENGILYGEDPPRPFQTNSRIERIREAVRKASERDWDYERIQSTASAYDESKCIDEWNSLLTPYID